MRKRGMKDRRTLTPLYRVWIRMKDRCANQPRYRDRGITVCQEWVESYIAFRDWALAHGYESGLSIDRKNNDGPYSPDNCRFVDRTIQQNNMRTNHLITALGETKTVAEWARDVRCEVDRSTLNGRLRSGWQPERAITEPCHENQRRT